MPVGAMPQTWDRVGHAGVEADSLGSDRSQRTVPAIMEGVSVARPVVLAAVAVLASGACASLTAGSEGSDEATSPATTGGNTADTVLIDPAGRDPLPFPGYEVDRVTIAPLPGSADDDGSAAPTTEALTGWAAFDQSLWQQIVQGGSQAFSVAVSIGGEVVHEAALGLKTWGTFELVDTDDRFRIASISKTISAITALQLVEAGVIGLDDPIGGLVAARVGVARPADRTTDITVRQLLTHTSGFAQYESLFFRDQVESCEEAAAVGFARSLSGTPGGGFRYSNMNYCVLGLLIEQLTERSYEAVVYEQLLTPLGISGMRLASTYDPGPDEVQHRSVPGRNYMEVLGAAGAWVATPSDLVRILDSLDHATPGFKPLEPDTVAVMKTSVNGGVPDRGYGMGLILYGGGTSGHTGTIESTHAMVVDRPDNITWAVTVAGEHPSDTPRLASMVQRALVAGGFLPA